MHHGGSWFSVIWLVHFDVVHCIDELGWIFTSVEIVASFQLMSAEWSWCVDGHDFCFVCGCFSCWVGASG